MTDPTNISCSLDGGEMQDRLADMAAIGAEGLRQARIEGTTAKLRFDPAMQRRLEAVLDEERRCCTWLAIEQDGGEVTVRAAPGGEPALAEWVAAFGARTRRREPRRG